MKVTLAAIDIFPVGRGLGISVMTTPRVLIERVTDNA